MDHTVLGRPWEAPKTGDRSFSHEFISGALKHSLKRHNSARWKQNKRELAVQTPFVSCLMVKQTPYGKAISIAATFYVITAIGSPLDI